MDIFFEIHKDLPREGPGDSFSTRRAFELLPALPQKPRILDIGCGPGMQTLDLASICTGEITAIDTHRPFLEQLRGRTAQRAQTMRINLVDASMFALPFAAASFDVLWSEGAIYILGFEQGLKDWRPLLRPGGCLAVTEISWLKPHPPAEVFNYWMADYPGMHSTQDNLSTLRSAGYREIGHFTLPVSSWWDGYYTPIQERLSRLRVVHGSDPQAADSLAAAGREIEMFRKYSDYYGYVFYVAQRV